MDSTITTIPSFNPSGNEGVQAVKDKTEELLKLIQTTVPEGRARSLALTNIEQGAMWAVKAFFV
jgi:hypothetical protein